MNFELGKEYIVTVTDKGIVPVDEFNRERFYDKDNDDLGDAISREAVLKMQAKYADQMGATKFWQMRDNIRALPPITPIRKKGHWIPVKEGEKWLYMCLDYKCSNCDCGSADDSDYCPVCGSEMWEDEE